MFFNFQCETKLDILYSESAFKSLQNKYIFKQNNLKCQSLSRWRHRQTLSDFPKSSFQKLLSIIFDWFVDRKNPSYHRHIQELTKLSLSTINKIIHQDLSKDTRKKFECSLSY